MPNIVKTTVENKRVPVLGEVTITYNDSSTVTHVITSLGETFYSQDERVPVKVTVFGTDYYDSQMPVNLQYPGGPTGKLSKGNFETEYSSYGPYLFDEVE